MAGRQIMKCPLSHMTKMFIWGQKGTILGVLTLHGLQGVYQLRKRLHFVFIDLYLTFSSITNVLIVTDFASIEISGIFHYNCYRFLSITSLKLGYLYFLNLPPYGYLMHKQLHILLYTNIKEWSAKPKSCLKWLYSVYN